MNPYKVLGIRPNATKDEIENAYRNIVETSNVDPYDDDPVEFRVDSKLSQVNEAYSTLMNNIKYSEIRSLIEGEQFIAAETELNLISAKSNAEWNYLKGFVMLKKGWFQAGVNHMKKAYELDPSNPEYKETLQLLYRKISQIKATYARAQQGSGGGGDMCGGGGGGGDMCGGGGSQGGAGIDPNVLQSMLGGLQGTPGVANGAQQGANPLQGMMGGNSGGNPLQNMLMQSMLGGGGGGGMGNLCGGGGGGGMC